MRFQRTNGMIYVAQADLAVSNWDAGSLLGGYIIVPEIFLCCVMEDACSARDMVVLQHPCYEPVD